MAISVARTSAGSYNIGNKRVRTANVTFTGSYAAGGESITPSAVGLRRIFTVSGVVTEASGQTTAWMPYWDATNQKLKLFGAGTGATGLTEHADGAYATATVGRQLEFVGE